MKKQVTQETATQEAPVQETKLKAVYEVRVSKDGVALAPREYTSRKIALSVASELTHFGLTTKIFLTKEIK